MLLTCLCNPLLQSERHTQQLQLLVGKPSTPSLSTKVKVFAAWRCFKSSTTPTR